MEKKKQQESVRRRQEDAALNKLLIWFGIAIGYEAVVLLLKRFYVNARSESEVGFALGLHQIFSVLQWVAPVLAVAAAVWTVTSWRGGKPVRAPAICTGVLLALSLTVILTYRFYSNGVETLGVVAPAAAILALIYYLYQREFFCNTLITGGGILCLWLYRRYYSGSPARILAGFIVGWVLLALAVLLAWKLSESGGKWKRWQVFSSKTSYVLTYVTCGVTALTMAAAMLGGGAVAYYAIFVLVIWLFCMAVYYTVRLM